MSQPVYTEIPPTSDLVYWEIKIQDNQQRSTTFVPRHKELHQQLKRKAWDAIQASQARKRKRT